MTRTIFIVLLSAGLLLVEARSHPLSSINQLTEQGEKAYQVLLTANQFEGDVIGYAAEPSKLVEAYRVLLKEPASDFAFKNLVRQATPAGQLYALCGLYFTDHGFFLAEVEKHRARSDYVQVQFGCIGSRMRVSTIVEVKAANVVRLTDASQSIGDWVQKHTEFAKKGYLLDIIGGGYPSEFSRKPKST